MGILENKIDFAVLISVNKANPNGDPTNGNRPRQDYDGYGEISDVCIKRKIRNRLQDMGQSIFCQSDYRRDDDFRSLKDRAEGCSELKEILQDKENKTQKYSELACKKWIDVRSFGQVFAYKSKSNDDNNESADSVSIGIKGAVSISPAYSVSPIEISSMQITKTVNGTTSNPPDKKGPDTMGEKHRVDFGLYVVYGSINSQTALLNKFSEEDSVLIKNAILSLFENDFSSARPEGSMEVCKLYWWKHPNKTGKYSSAKVHKSLKIIPLVSSPKKVEDYDIHVESLPELPVIEYDGF